MRCRNWNRKRRRWAGTLDTHNIPMIFIRVLVSRAIAVIIRVRPVRQGSTL
jgi:hypothetical protein